MSDVWMARGRADEWMSEVALRCAAWAEVTRICRRLTFCLFIALHSCATLFATTIQCMSHASSTNAMRMTVNFCRVGLSAEVDADGTDQSGAAVAEGTPIRDDDDMAQRRLADDQAMRLVLFLSSSCCAIGGDCSLRRSIGGAAATGPEVKEKRTAPAAARGQCDPATHSAIKNRSGTGWGSISGRPQARRE